MTISRFGRRSRRTKKAVSTIVGSIIVLGMVLSIGYGYFYTIIQDEQFSTKTGMDANLNAIQQQQERLIVTGEQIGPSLGFTVDNPGIATTITSFLITDKATGQVLQYNSGTGSSPSLPYPIGQGVSVQFTSALLAAPSQSYVIKLFTSRGSTFVGTFPSNHLGVEAVSALVAAGMGSASMVFSSYRMYNVSEVGSQWVVSVSQPYSGELVPYGITPAFSMNVTNNDPYTGTITLDSHSEIYLYEPCPKGCGSQVPVFAYFIVNVNQTSGVINSTTQGSFAPIQIPYGSTVRLYFASSNDLTVKSFATQSILSKGNGDCNTKVSCGEYDVFVILSGSTTEANGAFMYSENLPFAGSYVSDNVAWSSQTPTSCTYGVPTSFSLYVTSSQLSHSNIINVTLDASALSSISVPSVPGWTITQGPVITWTPNNGHQISGGQTTPALDWTGTPVSPVGTEIVFPITIKYASGNVTLEQTAQGCIVD